MLQDKRTKAQLLQELDKLEKMAAKHFEERQQFKELLSQKENKIIELSRKNNTLNYDLSRLKTKKTHGEYLEQTHHLSYILQFINILQYFKNETLTHRYKRNIAAAFETQLKSEYAEKAKGMLSQLKIGSDDDLPF